MKIRKVHPRWITIRKAVQFLLLVTFIYLFLISRQDVPGNDLIGHFMLFDPLLALTSLLSSRSFLALTVIELLLAVILALLAGRVWCGWLCPLGTTLDLVRFNKNYSARIPEEMRTTKYSLLLVILFASLFGNLTLLIFDPLTILYRTLGSSIHPALNQIVTIIETSLYPIPLFQGFISWLEVTLRPAVLPLEPLFFEQALLFGVFFLSI
ncbi:MAG: 4Fe-4S binding protein, partial [Chloroflexi bacterium]|nr:4Fe-4S binding protein [Chloroflexota bacterium]